MNDPLIIGFVGGSGSGKTTLASGLLALTERFGPANISQDDYYRGLPPGTDAATYNFDEPAAVDLELLAHHLRELRAGRAVTIPRYDFATHRRRAEGVELKPAPLIVVEGLFLYSHAGLRAAFDRRYFVDVPAAERLRRRVARDVRERGRTEEDVRVQFERQVQPMHELHVQPGRAYADVVIDLPHPDDLAYCEQVIALWGAVENELVRRETAGAARSHGSA